MEQIPASDTQVVKEVSTPLYEAKGWMKFLGVMSILGGVSLIPTIGGILIAWLPIWMGVLLWKAASEIEVAQLQGNKVKMVGSLSRLKTYFLVYGILSLISVIIAAVTMIVFGGVILAAIMDAI